MSDFLIFDFDLLLFGFAHILYIYIFCTHVCIPHCTARMMSSQHPTTQSPTLVSRSQQFVNLKMASPSRRCLHFEVVGGLEWSNDPESYAGGSVAIGRASLAGKVKGDDPD
jgi:hypothetical protein